MEEYNPDFVVDITGFTDKIYFGLQFSYDPTSKEPESPISTKNFLKV
jgi:hypothetical protein